MTATTLTTVFTKAIPAVPDPKTLYVSLEYRTAVHLCACGCGSKVVTPLGPNDWVLTFDGTVSLRPSVGNGQQGCRSHYYIRHDRIEWLPRISPRATNVAIKRDRDAHQPVAPKPTAASPERLKEAPTKQRPWWRRVWQRVTNTGRG